MLTATVAAANQKAKLQIMWENSSLFSTIITHLGQSFFTKRLIHQFAHSEMA